MLCHTIVRNILSLFIGRRSVPPMTPGLGVCLACCSLSAEAVVVPCIFFLGHFSWGKRLLQTETQKENNVEQS